jgi:DNA polymerase III epsilon subunit-like protein
VRFLALDFESGGLEVRERAPVTLGLAVFEDGHLVKSQEWLFKPIRNWKGELRYSYSDGAVRIHGKSLVQMDTEGQDASHVYKEVSEFLGDVWSDPIVSHNAPFDGEVWGNFMFSLGYYDPGLRCRVPTKELLTGPWICTRRIATNRLVVPHQVPNMKLDSVARFFGLGGQQATHGAVFDAVLAGQVFLSLLEAA